jgi:hypothetical protein
MLVDTGSHVIAFLLMDGKAPRCGRFGLRGRELPAAGGLSNIDVIHSAAGGSNWGSKPARAPAYLKHRSADRRREMWLHSFCLAASEQPG